MFLRAVLVGYVIGLGVTLLAAPRASETPYATAAMLQKQRQLEPEARLRFLRFDQPAR
ncbi:hypothetical protein [Thermaurantiacus sp.]